MDLEIEVIWHDIYWSEMKSFNDASDDYEEE